MDSIMADSPFATDVTQGTFAAEVLERSRELPVLVDFWAAWCGPCQMLMPVLARIVDSYGGRVRLAKVNTDAERDLATTHGIRSLPTVKLFRDGVVVDEFLGVQSESSIRTMIDRHLPRSADATIERARTELAAGHTRAGLDLLRAAVAEDPGYDRPKLELAQELLRQPADGNDLARADESEKLLASMSPAKRAEPDTAALGTRIKFLRLAAQAPPLTQIERALALNPNDVAARYQLSAHKIVAREYEPAMEHLLEIVRRDRRYGEDAARKALVEIFSLLGQVDARVAKYRALLARALN